MGTVWSLICETFNEWLEDKAERLGAGLAYYAAFSIAPLLIIVVSIVNFVYRGDTLPQIQHQIAMVAGNNAAIAIVATVRGIKSQGGSTMATVLSIVTLLIGATGVFSALQDSMNTIWEIKPRPDLGWMDMIKKRFFSLAMVFGVIFILLVSMLISTILNAMVVRFAGEGKVVGFALDVVLSLIVYSGVFMLLFSSR